MTVRTPQEVTRLLHAWRDGGMAKSCWVNKIAALACVSRPSGTGASGRKGVVVLKRGFAGVMCPAPKVRKGGRRSDALARYS